MGALSITEYEVLRLLIVFGQSLADRHEAGAPLEDQFLDATLLGQMPLLESCRPVQRRLEKKSFGQRPPNTEASGTPRALGPRPSRQSSSFLEKASHFGHSSSAHTRLGG